MRRPVLVPSFYATAAALLFAVGIGGALIEHSGEARQAARDSAVLATIATSHFDHIAFTARESSAPVSKVLYARDGAWFYVAIAEARCDCRVLARSAAGEHDVGTLEVRGNTATLFVRNYPRPTLLELVDASGRVISRAALSYPARQSASNAS